MFAYRTRILKVWRLRFIGPVESLRPGQVVSLSSGHLTRLQLACSLTSHACYSIHKHFIFPLILNTHRPKARFSTPTLDGEQMPSIKQQRVAAYIQTAGPPAWQGETTTRRTCRRSARRPTDRLLGTFYRHQSGKRIAAADGNCLYPAPLTAR